MATTKEFRFGAIVNKFMALATTGGTHSRECDIFPICSFIDCKPAEAAVNKKFLRYVGTITVSVAHFLGFVDGLPHS